MALKCCICVTILYAHLSISNIEMICRYLLTEHNCVLEYPLFLYTNVCVCMYLFVLYTRRFDVSQNGWIVCKGIDFCIDIVSTSNAHRMIRTLLYRTYTCSKYVNSLTYIQYNRTHHITSHTMVLNKWQQQN